MISQDWEKKHDWTNQEMVVYLLEHIIQRMEDDSRRSIPPFKRLDKDDPEYEQKAAKLLFDIQEGLLLRLFAYFDNFITPTIWPGIMIANEETGERLTPEELSWEYAAVTNRLKESQEGE